MGQALDFIRAAVDGADASVEKLVLRKKDLRDAVAEADALKVANADLLEQRDANLRAIDTLKNAHIIAEPAARECLSKEFAALEMELNRRAFENQILQMTQGALKIEIDRLRAEPAKLYATGAVVKFDRDGSVSVVADAVEMHSAAVPA